MSKPNCYEEALKAALENPVLHSWKVCHGIAILRGDGPHAGKEFGHAWVEKDDVVFDATTGQIMRKEDYYSLGQISYVKRYTTREALELADQRKHWGPWDKKIARTLHEEE